jgi:hypothetical protein
MISRRTLLKSGAGAVAATLAAPAIAQAPKKISFLTWNIIDQEPMIRGWIARFVKDRPGVEVEWLDKKARIVFYRHSWSRARPRHLNRARSVSSMPRRARCSI